VRIGIVLGYGVDLNEGYRRYLNFVGATCADLHVLVLCGGYTNPGIDQSEADVMFGYLSRYHVGVRRPMLMERDSYDTPSNLRNAQALLEREFVGQAYRVVVYCDQVRRLKVRWMSWWLFRPREVRSVERLDPGKRRWKQYLIDTPLDILAFHFRPLHRLKLARRLRQWGFHTGQIDKILRTV
jgi:hypothetical protein